jgi:UDP-N-acetylglucosamine 2-epimerase
MFRDRTPDSPVHFYRNFQPEDYARLIYNAACLVGNSSSALREGSFLGIPAVNIGSRQTNREHGANVAHANYNRTAIETVIRHQLEHGRYPGSKQFGDGTAGTQIVNILEKAQFKIQKSLHLS